MDHDLEKLRKIVNVKKNLTNVIKGIGYFLNIKQRLEEMEVLLQDEANFGLIAQKIENMRGMKAAILKNQKQTVTKYSDEFKKFEEFESKFNQRVLLIVFKILDNPKENSHLISDAYDIIYKNTDSKLDLKKKQWKLIVQTRFEQKLSNHKDIDFLIDNINFTADDLHIINDKLLTDQPEELFQFVAESYRSEVSKQILPFMQDLEFIKQNPGVLPNLLNWLDSYEKLLAKKGFQAVEFQQIRQKIKELMPYFHKHIQGIFKKYLDKILESDNVIFEKGNFEKMETQSAEDVAIFLNQQIDFLGVSLPDQLFFDLFSVWMEQLREYIEEFNTKAKIFAKNPGQFSLYIIVINNDQKLMLHLNGSKKKALEILQDERSKENLGRNFANIITFISQEIDEQLRSLVSLCFTSLKQEVFPQVFKQQWETDNPVETILNTLRDFSEHTSEMFKNRVHYSMFIKISFQHYFQCYFEQFVWIIKNAFHDQNVAQNFKPFFLGYTIEKENNRRDIKKFLSNKTLVKQLLKRDYDYFLTIFENFEDMMTETASEDLKNNNEYLLDQLFGSKQIQVQMGVPNLDEAVQFFMGILQDVQFIFTNYK